MLMFTMNDIGGTGSLSREEFARMLRFEQFPLLLFSFSSSWLHLIDSCSTPFHLHLLLL